MYLRDRNAGSLAIGASATAAHTLLPKALEKLMAESPGINISVRGGSITLFRPMLRDRAVDFVIVNLAMDFQDEEFEITPLCTYQSVFGIRNSYSFTEPLHLAQLLELPWVLPGQPGALGGSTFLEDLLETFKLQPPKRVVHCEALTTALSMMVNADMVGFFSKPLADQEFERLGLIQLPVVESTPKLSICIVSNKSAPLSLVAQRMVELLKLDAPNLTDSGNSARLPQVRRPS